MRNLSIFLMLSLLAACNWSASREEKTQELVSQEIQSIDWEDVDKYPLFADCDETVSKQEQKSCFMETLLLHFSTTLQESEFVLHEEVKDTIFIDFVMEDTGSITLMDIHNDEALRKQLPDFEKRIKKSLGNLPKIEPALKRGIPVSAKFRIPIVLSSQWNKFKVRVAPKFRWQRYIELRVKNPVRISKTKLYEVWSNYYFIVSIPSPCPR